MAKIKYSLDDVVEMAAQAYKEQKGEFNAEKISANYQKNRDWFEDYFKKALAGNRDFSYGDVELMVKMPEMCYSINALSVIESDSCLTEVYVPLMLRLCNNKLPQGIELMVIFLVVDKLIRAFSNCGYVWSERAKRQIERFHPELYEPLFNPVRNFSSWMDI